MTQKDQQLTLTIDQESVSIYREQGEDKDPIHVCYWYFEEWD
jgi:hypothetical protein